MTAACNEWPPCPICHLTTPDQSCFYCADYGPWDEGSDGYLPEVGAYLGEDDWIDPVTGGLDPYDDGPDDYDDELGQDGVMVI